MSFPKYESYVDSGLEWLGSVPSHWAVKRLGHFFEERREKVSDKDFAPLSVTMKGIVPRLETAAKTQDGDNRKKVLEGDFVINSRSDRKGSSGVAPQDGSVSLICIVARPKGIEPYFAHHLLRSVSFQEEFYRYGKGIVADLWSTGYSEMKNIVIPVPPSPEQQKIAAFLDHETAKIDVLIAEQQRLIELLKEKRQAVISHAVTKGLNPGAPMKDSGVEWLGEVPGHWEVSRIGWLCEIGNGCTPSRSNPDYWDNSGFTWLNSSNVNLPKVTTSDQGVSHLALQECALPIVKPGSVLIAITGEGKTRGMVTRTIIEATINQHVAFIAPYSKRIESSFLHDWLAANYQRVRYESKGWGSTKAAITCGDIRQYPIPVPPVDEQIEITRSITKRSISFDELIGEAKKTVSLLVERRSVLISAAVTGKIDVRGWRPSESASPEPVSQAAEEAAGYG